MTFYFWQVKQFSYPRRHIGASVIVLEPRDIVSAVCTKVSSHSHLERAGPIVSLFQLPLRNVQQLFVSVKLHHEIKQAVVPVQLFTSTIEYKLSFLVQGVERQSVKSSCRKISGLVTITTARPYVSTNCHCGALTL